MQSTQTYVKVDPAKEPMTVAELLLYYLELEGVRNIFGVPGAALSYVLNALKERQDKFTYHICRHESGASYMADGFSRVGGKLGVVLVSSGPGATNALTGSVTALYCYSSVLVISGEVPEHVFGKHSFQEGADSGLDVSAIYRNANQYSALVTDPRNFQTFFTRALRTALSLPRRATHIGLPEDIGGETFAQEIYIPKHPRNYRAIPSSHDPAAAERVMDILAKAENPLLFLGNGCRAALLPGSLMSPEERAATAERMRRFRLLIEKFALPVVTSPNGKGIFPETHAMSLRNYGFGGCQWARWYIQATGPAAAAELRYDALLILGSSLGQKTTDNWDPVLIPFGPLVQVDLDQSAIGRGFPLDFGVVAEVGAFIDDLIRYGECMKPNESIVARRRHLIAEIRKFPPEPPPQAFVDELVRCVAELSPRGAHIFVDATTGTEASLRYMTIDPPIQMHNAFTMEPMGWAAAAVVGAGLADPDAACIAVTGDGGFMMNGNEVSTAAQYKVGAVWVVLYNDTLANVERYLAKEFGGLGWMNLYQLGSPDLATVARGLGAHAVEVYDIGAFRTAFTDALTNARMKHQPQVIVAKLLIGNPDRDG